MGSTRTTNWLLAMIAVSLAVIALGEVRHLVIADAHAQSDRKVNLFACYKPYGACEPVAVLADEQGRLLVQSK